LLIKLLNGSPFILNGNEVFIHKFIQWAQKVHVEENGFEQIFNVVMDNSIIVHSISLGILFNHLHD